MKTKKLINQKRQHVEGALKPPGDLERGEALLAVTGQQEAYIENYKGILECSESQVVIATGRCKLCFQGKKLHIAYYTDEEMKIEGLIQTISFI